MSEGRIQAHFEASDAVLDWCLRNALRLERRGETEQAALWAHVAAGTAAEFGHSYLCSAPLESLLSRLGNRLPSATLPARGNGATRGRRWLHIFSRTVAMGGHTALARRWVVRNPFGEQHSVALNFQDTADIDPAFADAVRRSGGAIHSLERTGSLLGRAAALRRLACEQADVVVVHTHPWDVLPSIAFGAPGGPPVLLVNHADHAFWVGCAISDIVVDIRDSGLALSTSLRGVRGSAVLPVPLEDRGPSPRDRSIAAARLPDPTVLARGLVLLTIGIPHKYQPSAPLDFPRTIGLIVDAIDDCTLIAVGPSPGDPLWQSLADRTGGRVAAVGMDPDLAPWHAAADLYLEGFPIGSYTALLEVALAARAFVRKPHLAPPSVLPVDRGALAAFDPPPDPDAYAAAAIAMGGDPDRCEAQAQQARHAVLAAHCGEGWDTRLEALQRAIPPRHETGFGCEPRPMPAPLAAYWAGVHAARVRQPPLTWAQERAHEQGLQPRTDVAVLDAQ